MREQYSVRTLYILSIFSNETNNECFVNEFDTKNSFDCLLVLHIVFVLFCNTFIVLYNILSDLLCIDIVSIISINFKEFASSGCIFYE